MSYFSSLLYYISQFSSMVTGETSRQYHSFISLPSPAPLPPPCKSWSRYVEKDTLPRGAPIANPTTPHSRAWPITYIHTYHTYGGGWRKKGHATTYSAFQATRYVAKRRGETSLPPYLLTHSPQKPAGVYTLTGRPSTNKVINQSQLQTYN